MDFIALVVAIAAATLAWRLKGRMGLLEIHARGIDAELRSARDQIAALLRGMPSPDGPSGDSGGPVETVARPRPLDEAAPNTPTSVPVTPIAPSLPAPVSALPRPSLEERLGTRWAVWVGGLALAAGGLLLVRYSIEQGIFGPGVRIVLGAAFSTLLIGLGEWLRRSRVQTDFAALPIAHIPSVLTAAGTMAAFATIYAAHALYDFIGPAAAFILLGAAGIATMLAAALHGPALAGLGLAGALATPMLVTQAAQPSPWPLVLYLAVVAASSYALARARRWLWLAATVVAGVVVWGAVLNLDGPPPVDWNLARHVFVVVHLTLAAVALAWQPYVGHPDETAVTDRVASLGLAALTALAVTVLANTPAATADWTLAAVLAMAVLVATAYSAAPAAAALAWAGIVALTCALAWPGLRAPPDTRFLWPAVADFVSLPDTARTYMAFTALSSLAILAAGTWRLWRGRTLPRPIASLYALGAILTPLAVLVIIYLRMTQFDRSISFALIAVLLAAVLYAVADRFDNVPAEQKSPHTGLMISLYAAGCTAAMALAFTFALERGYLTVAFAVTAATTALFAVIDKIPSLRGMVGAIGMIVLARLAWDPRIAGADVGSLPVFNWLLLGYGAPAAAFLFAGHTLRRTQDDFAARLADALGILFAALLVFFQIRHALNGGDIRAPVSSHIEQGLIAFTALGFAGVLNRLDLARGNPVFRWAMMIAGVVAAAVSTLGLLFAENPYLNGDPVHGAPVFSSLMLGYLLPAIAAAVVARTARGVRPAWYVTAAAALALVLLFAYATLETRHLFQGERITVVQPTSSAEMWAYSAVWLTLGLAFLAYGLVRSSVEARIASALLVVVAAVKVFVFDTSGVTGIWRPLSFICLGAVLIGIGLVYQRLIFARPATRPTPAEPPSAN